MLVPGQVDLADLALALEDHSAEHSWWLDPQTGELEPLFHGAPIHADDVAAKLRIEPLPTAVGYRDMQDFVACVRDPRVRDQLERAIAGRGAFRRFKDALLEHPDLRRAWFNFHDARSERRALEWLLEHELVEPDAAQTELARRPELPDVDLPGLLNAHGVARRVVAELRRLYRSRLLDVVLVGAWARGGVHPESPLELVVVLDGIANRWEEKRRMERVAWRHSVRYDAVVTMMPVRKDDLGYLAPQLTGAMSAGVKVA